MSQMGRFYAKTPIETITGNTGGPVGPDILQNLTIIGTGTATFDGNPLTNTITFNDASTAPEQFTTDSGVVIAVGDNANIFGAHGINTAGAADTITIAVNNTLMLGDLAHVAGDTLTISSGNIGVTDGNVNLTAGNINLPTTFPSGMQGIITVNGSNFIHSLGVGNTFVGSNSGNLTLTGSELTGLGISTLNAITSGDNNTAVGTYSQSVVTDGAENTSLGSDALLDLTTGDQNTALGSAALSSIITGNNNIGVGYNAGSTYVGAESNNIVIGSSGVVADAGAIRIGTTATHTSVYVAGIDGVSVGNVATVVTESGNKLGTAVITAGTGITITPTANTITIASAAAAVWTVETVDLSFAAGKGYIANKAGLLTVTLPATGAIGDVLDITNMNTALGWKIAQNANQFIRMGALLTTVGVGGSVSSTALGDSLKLICNVAGASTGWIAVSSIGNLVLV